MSSVAPLSPDKARVVLWRIKGFGAANTPPQGVLLMRPVSKPRKVQVVKELVKR